MKKDWTEKHRPSPEAVAAVWDTLEEEGRADPGRWEGDPCKVRRWHPHLGET